MLKLKKGRSVPHLLSENEATVQQENMLRIVSVVTDLAGRAVRVFLQRGYMLGIFYVSNPEPVVVEISDMPEHTVLKTIDGRLKPEIVPARLLFTQLITPLESHTTRWAGDFRLCDIERMIVENNLLPQLEIEEIVPQT